MKVSDYVILCKIKPAGKPARGKQKKKDHMTHKIRKWHTKSGDDTQNQAISVFYTHLTKVRAFFSRWSGMMGAFQEKQ